jgi:hypothetical protein
MTPDQRLQEGTHMTGHGISTWTEATIDHGWREVADIALAFVQKHAQP